MRQQQQLRLIHFPARWARSIAAVMLPILLFSMVGFPLPIAPRKLVSERFPCENSPCGCLTASHCWDKCCCNTDEQKLAWAERNNVPPPEFLVQRVAAKRDSVGDARKTSCCTVSKPQCCSQLASNKRTTGTTVTAIRPEASGKHRRINDCNALPEASACGSQFAACSTNVVPGASACGSQPECEQGSVKAANQYKVVFLHSALQCNGVELSILFFSHGVVSPRVDSRFFDAPRITAWLTLCDDFAESYLTCPDGPVPWLFADA